ncbi:MAG TPA: acetate/propionate family kinase [Methylomirabilota bacterium]|nr:acetate/propionate family kinase [Methylomirabilota bacterium]
MGGAVLALNAGSSTLKFATYAVDGAGGLGPGVRGVLDAIGTRPRLLARDAGGAALADETYAAAEVPDAGAAAARVLGWLGPRLGGRPPLAVGHRVVHGGVRYAAPVAVDGEVLAALEALVPLAPLHQPGSLAPIRVLRARLPEVVQVACFDTAFHRGHPDVADRFAVPEALHREGVRRYGFHGLSYEAIVHALPAAAPALAGGRVVVAHLGHGASMCAIAAGRSVESTMGFSALDGLPMGTRCGQIDPGVLLYLLRDKGLGAAELERFLYHECGLKGLSGLSGDVRDLLASDAAPARLAVDYFVHRIARELGALSAVLGGLDGLVFTGGIGEHSAEIRARVCRRAAWLGLRLDEEANAAGGPRISAPDSAVSAWRLATDEEGVIARHAWAVWAAAPGRASARRAP